MYMISVKKILIVGVLLGPFNLAAWDYVEHLEQFRRVSMSFREQLKIELRTNVVKAVEWNQPTNITVKGVSYIWGKQWNGRYLKSAETGKHVFERIGVCSYPSSSIAIELICIEPSLRQHMGKNGHYDGVGVWQDKDWLLIADAASTEYYAAYKNITLVLRYVGNEAKPDEEMFEVLRAIIRAGLKEPAANAKNEENSPMRTTERPE